MLNRIEFLDIYDDPDDPKSLEVIEAFFDVTAFFFPMQRKDPKSMKR
jgi:hypothetical protein